MRLWGVALWIVSALLLAACQAPARAADATPPAATPAMAGPGATRAATHTPLPSAAPTCTPTAQPLPPASHTPASEEPSTGDNSADTLLLARPIAPPGEDRVDPSYRFGNTQGGRRDPHHGVELLNPSGTPVLAAAEGVVFYAGDDRQLLFSPYYYYYGNLVILEHRLAGLDQPLYTLYAHLSEIEVTAGDPIRAGQQIGKVGMSGSATGSHLHFEVRLGENSYAAARNPELWLGSGSGEPGGALAGVLHLPPFFRPEPLSIVVEPLDPASGARTTYIAPYEEAALTGQPPWKESFALGALPTGRYRVSFILFGYQEQEFEIHPGRVTTVEFDLSQAGE